MEIIDFFLIVLVIVLIFVYIKQCREKETFKTKEKTIKEIKESNKDDEYYNYIDNYNYHLYDEKGNMDISLENEKEINDCVKQNNIDFIQSSKNNLVEFTNGKKHMGPVKNFHQCFNNQNFKSNELGWRDWWIKNKTKNNVKVTKNTNKFMENYLNNLEHLKNIYI